MPVIAFLLIIFKGLSLCFAMDNEFHPDLMGSFIVIKDQKGNLCLTDFDPYSNEPSKSKNSIFYYVKNASLQLGETYTFSSRPEPPSPFSRQQGLRVTKKLNDNIYEVIFPEDKKNDVLSQKSFIQKKTQIAQDIKDRIISNKERYYNAQTDQINTWLERSSRQDAKKRSEQARLSNILVFKDFYIGMPLSDALWVLKDFSEPFFQFNYPDTSNNKSQPFKYNGVLKLFTKPRPYDEVFERAITDLQGGWVEKVDLNLRLETEIENNSTEIATLFFDHNQEVTAIFLKRSFLNKMFKIETISDTGFINLFKENYNISPNFEQSNEETKVYVTSFETGFGGLTKAISDDSSIVSFIDPRGIRISFSNSGGYTRSLLIHKSLTPKEIKDSFN